MTDKKYECYCDPNNLPQYCPAQQARYDRMLEFIKNCIDAAGAYHPGEDAEKLLREIGEHDD